MCDCAEYKRFFDDAPMALVKTSTRSGEFVMANKSAASLFGYTTPEEFMKNLNAKDLYQNPKERKKIIASLVPNELSRQEVNMILPSGRRIVVAATFRLTDDGEYIESCMEDITALKKLESEKLNMLQCMSKKLDEHLELLDEEAVATIVPYTAFEKKGVRHLQPVSI